MTSGKALLVLAGSFLITALFPYEAFAHRSGCHNLHTCPSDSNTYVCGDLGYPCNGATSIKEIPLSAIAVPLVVEKAFVDTFGRSPSDAESKYWKNRFRGDKDGLYKIRRTMAYYKGNSSFGPKVTPATASARLAKEINALFRTIYHREPTLSENQYWLTRLRDKSTAEALKGAMAFHQAHHILH